jgi:hypothetical protein
MSNDASPPSLQVRTCWARIYPNCNGGDERSQESEPEKGINGRSLGYFGLALFFGVHIEEQAEDVAASLDLGHRSVPTGNPAIGDRELLPFHNLRADGSGANTTGLCFPLRDGDLRLCLTSGGGNKLRRVRGGDLSPAREERKATSGRLR